MGCWQWVPDVVGTCAGADAAAGEAATEQQQLWRANMEEFNRRLRHEACVQFVRDKHGSVGAAALAAMLFASRHAETQVPAPKPNCTAACCQICQSAPARPPRSCTDFCIY